MQRPVAHLPAEEIHEDAETAEKDREPQIEVLEDRREDRPVSLEVEHTPDVFVFQLAVDEDEPGFPPPVEVDERAILGPLFDESGACRRRDGREGLSVGAQLDVELASVGLLVFSSRAGVLHNEALYLTNVSQIYLQEQRPVPAAPSVSEAFGHAPVHRLLRSLIRTTRHASSN